MRPLKTINALPGMKKLISALITSIPEFVNVLAFLIFVLVLFATIALHQYNGVYYNACRITPEPILNEWSADVSSKRLCTETGLGNYQCPLDQICGNPKDYP